ncbi:MAG: tRNA (adenosine(37)-N6)-threonylcarbamoyltransferase complex transferase subunit TsaD [Parasporobacterium sp.]|nr:tRNA (adenosine(37)-N6)-threonylcarbamoyltransferase complex transferase subunit TsaD [Parasporobacterium sp.]
MKQVFNREKDIVILGIESSCDETAAAVSVNGTQILSNVIYSQIDLHTLYGGVVPEIASRMHIAKINQVIKKALADAKITLDDLDAVAVTYGPGLVGALLVGVSEAKAIAWAKDISLVGVNHIKGHVCANYIEHPQLKPPFLCLVASGGHTHLVKATDYTDYEIIGRTRDDAAGEAYDKIARAIGLGYPGGPKVEKAARSGDPEAFAFPRAKIDENPYDFSFSGVKSAVLNTINSCKMKGMEIDEKLQADVAASFQAAVIDSLRERVLMAIDEFGIRDFAMAGGVASNQALRGALKAACEQEGVNFYCPSPIYCTDNAAMIAVAGYFEYRDGNLAGLDLNAVPGLRM